MSIPTAVYPVPSPGFVFAPRATSTCVKNQTITTFAGSFSFNAIFRLGLPKGSKVFAIVTNTAVIEYSMGGAKVTAKALSRVDLKSTVLY